MAAPRRSRALTADMSADAFFETLPLLVREESARELKVFVDWYGADRPLRDLKAEQVAAYAKEFGPAAPDPVKRLAVLRA
ncbi:MAG: hypothetical protein NTZ05_03985, partial [Chloroflexi bacterium]|nr:hypothetical protein [Chloroflexota bacterium]